MTDDYLESNRIQSDGTQLTENLNYIRWGGLLILVVLLVSPWLFFCTLIGLICGFFGLEFLERTIKPIVIKQLKLLQPSEVDKLVYDPLLHPSKSITSLELESSPCAVCQEKQCHRDSERHLQALRRSTSSSSSSSSTVKNLELDARMDAALARFFTAVFDAYVNPNWAPYGTRDELKRALVQVLLTFGHHVKFTFFMPEDQKLNFVKQKALPLLIYHMNALLDESKTKLLSAEEQLLARKRVLDLTQSLITKVLPPGDLKCKVWTQLCLSVLGDGVFWNLILLGRKEIPELLIKELSINQIPPSDSQGPILSVPATVTMEANIPSKPVSILFDSFLDPIHDVEQPLQIVSRYRPSLNYILGESDLLYCLIHFLKGEGALEWLQTVLEEDKKLEIKSFSKRIIELKHLNHFVRSRIFLENLGFHQVEPAFEVEPDDFATGKSVSHHARSSSYGGGSAMSSGIWEQNVVDGFAIYPLLNQSHQSITPLALPVNHSSTPIETDSLFRRRHTLEPFILKFYASLQKNKTTVQEESADSMSGVTRRVGSQTKVYPTDELTFVQDINCPDLLKAISEAASSLLPPNSTWRGVFNGWSNFLHPFIKNKSEEILDAQIEQLLTLDNAILFVDFVTDAFLKSQQSESASETPKEIPRSSTSSYFDWFLDNVIKRERLIQLLSISHDRILLFFIDLLDVMVMDILES